MKRPPNTEWWVLAFVLLWALVLRIYGLDYSFSNDELSALSRTTYDNFGELIRHGVMADFHPALVQFFLFFWTSFVPITEFGMRIPFVLLGVGSIFMVYLVAKEWFGNQTAILTAASMAGLQFFIMYSQLARPYSPGLFFTWWMMLHWTRILKEKGKYTDALLGGLATALAMYTHYFSFMQVMIVSLLGLVWVNRRTFRYYVIAGVTALVLWLPHFTITTHHLGKGGVGSWLGAPESDYLWSFLLFVFNDSSGIFIMLLLSGLVALTFSLPHLRLNRWQLACVILFAVPFAIGYYYSRLINPVLQYSTLLFATPCILVFLFSFAGPQIPRKILTGLLLLILCGTTFSTAIINRYYSTEGFGVFRELAEQIKIWDETYGTQNVVKVANLNSPGYLEHYFKQLDHPTKLELYDVEPDSNLALLRNTLDDRPEEYLAFAWSTHHVPLEAYLIMRRAYPYLLDADPHFNSAAYLFSKTKGDELPRKYFFSVLDSLSSGNVHGVDQSKVLRDSTGVKYLMRDADEYALSWEQSIDNMPVSAGDVIAVRAVIESEPGAEVTLVIEMLSDSSDNKWYGKDLYPAYSNSKSLKHEIFAALQVPQDISEIDRFKVYLWKRSKLSMTIETLEISLHPFLVPEIDKGEK